ncbi:glycosyl hydrolase family 65 protein [Sinomonas sp. JGH33]|uniref:Glycosyl hydrolase family 65 protein n=1 Tax=Sinomonas terricola TaxID=3110330 RepID=A0ABU5TB69_9MICC|nr:glycosyl hydrolase family 65 protein [Sinomonas sp. JGH33]MEA5456833.1 glycosyl hydrolase family 65 protein [Sinomonas sp. JGH33]
MAGTIDVVQRTFAGLRLTRDALIFSPRMPKELRSVRFRVRYRDQLLDVDLEAGALRVTSAAADAEAVRICVSEEEILLEPGASHCFQLSRT